MGCIYYRAGTDFDIKRNLYKMKAGKIRNIDRNFLNSAPRTL